MLSSNLFTRPKPWSTVARMCWVMIRSSRRAGPFHTASCQAIRSSSGTQSGRGRMPAVRSLTSAGRAPRTASYPTGPHICSHAARKPIRLLRCTSAPAPGRAVGLTDPTMSVIVRPIAASYDVPGWTGRLSWARCAEGLLSRPLHAFGSGLIARSDRATSPRPRAEKSARSRGSSRFRGRRRRVADAPRARTPLPRLDRGNGR